MQMKITISANLCVEDLPPDLVPVVRESLTVRNPEYVTRQRLGKWLGNVPPTLTLADQRDGALVLPRGYLEQIFSLAQKYGIPVETDDNRVLLPSIDISFRGELRDYQIRALQQMIQHDCGVLVAPCGSGKTALGMALIANFRQPALVLVHTRDLLEQTRKAVRQWLGVEAGIIGGGKCDIRPVTVGMVQTLVRRPEISRQFGVVLLDEAHHCPAATFVDVIQRFPARYRFGLTATPDRADGLGKFMTSVIGPIRHAILHDELRASSVLVVPRIEFVPTDFYFPYADNWTDLITALIRDPQRNGLIYSTIARLLDEGRRILCLSQRVGHAEMFYNAFERYKPGIAALAVGTLKKERAQAITRISKGEARLLFASQIGDEGLNLPCLDALILMTPSRSEGRTIQRVGRILRSVDGKRIPEVYDFVDGHIPLLRNQARARFFGAYRQLSPGACLPDWLENRKRVAV
jgi:superfamily II DNA or RNA helicase